jgi:hypothetical protein
MVQRLKSVFWPSKGMAVLGAIVFLALAIWVFTQGPIMLGIGLGLLLYACWYAFVLVYKLRRDYQLSNPDMPVQTPSPVIPKRSREANQFIVPPARSDER